MIKMSFVALMENTEAEARKFFEHNPSLMTADDLIALAEEKRIFDDPTIDPDLFKHLMKRYIAVGYCLAASGEVIQ